MACKNDKSGSKHSRLCEIKYPYNRTAPSNDVSATRQRDCTVDVRMVPLSEVNQTLGFEASMDLVSLSEFDALMGDNAKFGTYCDAPKSGGLFSKKDQSAHFCVDKGRKTVDGRRLAWLWVYPDGVIRPAHKVMSDNPVFVWTKQQIIDAYKAAKNETLPMYTRHVDQHSELAITFCLPFPT